jgi:gliding motility-associated-like protein
VQFGNPINLSTTPVGGLANSTYSYAWSGPLAASTLSCTNCQTPVATPFDTTTYFVNVTDRIGCYRNDTVHVYQAPDAGPDLKVCPLGERPVQMHVSGPKDATFHWYDYGSSNPGQYLSCTECTDPVAAPVPPVYTYTVGYDGCPVLDTIVVYHDTSNYIITPQDLMVQCRPGYRTLLSEAKGPFPKLNIPCGIDNPITCTSESTATVGTTGTPPKAPMNSPFQSTKLFTKYQFIIKKRDLLDAGLYSGTINSMAFYVLNSAIQAKGPLSYVFISLACTDQSDFPDPAGNNSFMGASALTPVATLTDYALTAGGWNNMVFDKGSYSWDTSKNLLVDLCIGPLTDTSATGLDMVSMMEGTAIQRYSNTTNACDNSTPVVYRYEQKPVVRFSYCETPDLPFEYTWRPGNNLNDSTVQNPRAYIAHSQDYRVYSVGRNGCQLMDSLRILVPEHHLGLGPADSFICQGQPAFMYASGGQAYHWYEVQGDAFTDASGSLSCTDCATPIGHPMQTTRYAVVFDNEVGVGNEANPEYATGCPDTMYVTLNVRELPHVVVPTGDTLITIGQSVPLYVQGALHYTWSPSGSVSDPNAPATIATPTVTTTYVATGYDQHNCSSTDTVKVSVNYHTNLLLPSGFTPNGDGVNDEFRVVNANVQRLLEFRVFNRWGQEVFSTTDIRRGWDGTWGGEAQPVGVYQYLIRVGYADQTIETYKGDVTLIR